MKTQLVSFFIKTEKCKQVWLFLASLYRKLFALAQSHRKEKAAFEKQPRLNTEDLLCFK